MEGVVKKTELAIELVPLATTGARLSPPMILEGTPSGTRWIIEVSDGYAEGERLKARQKGAASADWATITPDGQILTLDVRVTMETEDGALIYTHYSGRADVSQGPARSAIYAAPLYETGDPRYAWLNKIQAVAKGKVSEDLSRIDWEVYEVR